MGSTPVTYTSDLHRIQFKSNTFTQNFYTGGRSLIHFEGAPRLFFENDVFTDNGDNCKEAINTYGTGILTAATSEMDIDTAVQNVGNVYPGSKLGQSLITVKRSYTFSYTGLRFTNNWQIENDYSARA